MNSEGLGDQTGDLRLRIASLDVELRALEITSQRALASSGGQGPNPSLLKLMGTELQQASSELLLDIAGPDAMPRQTAWLLGESDEPPIGPDWAATSAAAYFQLRAASIYGGSNEIQRNIIARTVLEL